MLLVVVIFVLVTQCAGILFPSGATITPAISFVEEGGPLILNCTSTSVSSTEMSFKLFSNKATSVLPSKIVGPKTIQFAMDSVTLNMSGNFQCMNSARVLKFIVINVGRQPVSPEIQCSSVNMIEDVLCRFVPTLSEVKNNTRLGHINRSNFVVTCYYSFDYGGNWHNCSGTENFNDSGIFWQNNPPFITPELVIRMNVCNVLNCSFKEEIVRRCLNDRPKPPMVEVNSTKHSVLLNWKMATIPSSIITISNFTFRIHCSGESVNKTFTNLTMYSREVPDIPPYTDVKCEVRAKSTRPCYGQWSDPVIVATKTKEDAPRKSPDVGPGIYSVDSPTDGTKDVHIYYEALKKEDRNGVIQHYRVTCPSGNILETKHEAVCSKLHPDGDYVISVAACTRVGCSQPASTIHVLPTSSGNTLQSPELYIICGEDSDSCTFHYKLPSSVPDDAKLYLVSCLRDKRKEKCAEVYIEPLRRNESSVVKNVTDFILMKYTLALVSGDRRSPIESRSWIQCFYKGSNSSLPSIVNQFVPNPRVSCSPLAWICSVLLKFKRFEKCEESISPLASVTLTLKASNKRESNRSLTVLVSTGEWNVDVYIADLSPTETYTVYASYRLMSGKNSTDEKITSFDTDGMRADVLWVIVGISLFVVISVFAFAYKGLQLCLKSCQKKKACTDGIRSIVRPTDSHDENGNYYYDNLSHSFSRIQQDEEMQSPPIIVDVNSIPNGSVEPPPSTREEPVVAPLMNGAVPSQVSSSGDADYPRYDTVSQARNPEITVIDEYVDAVKEGERSNGQVPIEMNALS